MYYFDSQNVVGDMANEYTRYLTNKKTKKKTKTKQKKTVEMPLSRHSFFSPNKFHIC